MNESKSAPVYVCEDEPELASAIQKALSPRYQVVLSETGAEAMRAARAGQALLLVMDRKLRGADGLALVESLRAEGIRTPVLMMSAMGAVDDRVAGLQAGGDDYLVKPFAMVEFSARIDALVRRLSDSTETVLNAGALSMDLIARKVRRRGRDIELLPREFKLLEYFMRRPGQVVTRQILELSIPGAEQRRGRAYPQSQDQAGRAGRKEAHRQSAWRRVHARCGCVT